MDVLGNKSGYSNSQLPLCLPTSVVSKPWIRTFFVFVAGVMTGCLLVSQIGENKLIAKTAPISLKTNEPSIPIPMDEFPEAPWRTPNTLEVRTVTSTKFARFEIHKVKTDNGLIINDWLWTDERSHVNILVHLRDENKYLVFKQHKYGLDRDYFALIGGLFNAGETNGRAVAKRELLEETGLEAEELIDLGKYRVQVNRGGGILFAYYAKNCFKSDRTFKEDNDYEKQDHIKLSRDELIDITLGGEVGEAQWVATAALALLYEEHKEDHVDHKQTDGLKVSKKVHTMKSKTKGKKVTSSDD